MVRVRLGITQDAKMWGEKTKRKKRSKQTTQSKRKHVLCEPPPHKRVRASVRVCVWERIRLNMSVTGRYSFSCSLTSAQCKALRALWTKPSGKINNCTINYKLNKTIYYLLNIYTHKYQTQYVRGKSLCRIRVHRLSRLHCWSGCLHAARFASSWLVFLSKSPISN